MGFLMSFYDCIATRSARILPVIHFIMGPKFGWDRICDGEFYSLVDLRGHFDRSGEAGRVRFGRERDVELVRLELDCYQ